MGRYGEYVTRYRPDGSSFAVWEGNPVARIQDDMLNSAVYLYKSEEAARNGDNAGGSGFLVEMPSQRHKGLLHVYAVSNAHVVRQRFSVVRLVTSKGETM